MSISLNFCDIALSTADIMSAFLAAVAQAKPGTTSEVPWKDDASRVTDMRIGMLAKRVEAACPEFKAHLDIHTKVLTVTLPDKPDIMKTIGEAVTHPVPHKHKSPDAKDKDGKPAHHRKHHHHKHHVAPKASAAPVKTPDVKSDAAAHKPWHWEHTGKKPLLIAHKGAKTKHVKLHPGHSLEPHEINTKESHIVAEHHDADGKSLGLHKIPFNVWERAKDRLHFVSPSEKDGDRKHPLKHVGADSAAHDDADYSYHYHGDKPLKVKYAGDKGTPQEFTVHKGHKFIGGLSHITRTASLDHYDAEGKHIGKREHIPEKTLRKLEGRLSKKADKASATDLAWAKRVSPEKADPHRVEDLKLYGDNTGHLEASKHATIATLAKHHKRGVYDPAKARIHWGHHADAVAQAYHKEINKGKGEWHHHFPKHVREAAAAQWEKEHRPEGVKHDKAAVDVAGEAEHEKFKDHTKNPYHKIAMAHGFTHESTTHEKNRFAKDNPKADYTRHVYKHPEGHVLRAEQAHGHVSAYAKEPSNTWFLYHKQRNGITAPSSGNSKPSLERTLTRHGYKSDKAAAHIERYLHKHDKPLKVAVSHVKDVSAKPRKHFVYIHKGDKASFVPATAAAGRQTMLHSKQSEGHARIHEYNVSDNVKKRLTSKLHLRTPEDKAAVDVASEEHYVHHGKRPIRMSHYEGGKRKPTPLTIHPGSQVHVHGSGKHHTDITVTHKKTGTDYYSVGNKALETLKGKLTPSEDKRKYYTLAIKHDGKWGPEAGAYERETMKEEMTEHKRHGVKGHDMTIITTNGPAREEVESAIAKLNRGDKASADVSRETHEHTITYPHDKPLRVISRGENGRHKESLIKKGDKVHVNKSPKLEGVHEVHHHTTSGEHHVHHVGSKTAHRVLQHIAGKHDKASREHDPHSHETYRHYTLSKKSKPVKIQHAYFDEGNNWSKPGMRRMAERLTINPGDKISDAGDHEKSKSHRKVFVNGKEHAIHKSSYHQLKGRLVPRLPEPKDEASVRKQSDAANDEIKTPTVHTKHHRSDTYVQAKPFKIRSKRASGRTVHSEVKKGDVLHFHKPVDPAKNNMWVVKHKRPGFNNPNSSDKESVQTHFVRPRTAKRIINRTVYGETNDKASVDVSKGGAGFAKGTKVKWHYRSAIGHGTIVGVHKPGDSHATTEYSIKQIDHHPGESPIVYHYGKALSHDTAAIRKLVDAAYTRQRGIMFVQVGDTASERKAKPLDHEAYTKEEKRPKYSVKISPLHPTAGYNEKGRMLRHRLPEYSKEDHLQAGDEHSREAHRHRKEKSKLINHSLEKLKREGKDAGPLISGIHSDHFDDKTKNKLRELGRKHADHLHAAFAHYAAAGKHMLTARERYDNQDGHDKADKAGLSTKGEHHFTGLYHGEKPVRLVTTPVSPDKTSNITTMRKGDKVVIHKPGEGVDRYTVSLHRPNHVNKYNGTDLVSHSLMRKHNVNELVSKLDKSDEARVFSKDRYEWRKYTGKRAKNFLWLRGKASMRKVHRLEPGDKFGIRHATSASAKGKHRVVLHKHGLNKVFTITGEHAKRLKALSKEVKSIERVYRKDRAAVEHEPSHYVFDKQRPTKINHHNGKHTFVNKGDKLTEMPSYGDNHAILHSKHSEGHKRIHNFTLKGPAWESLKQACSPVAEHKAAGMEPKADAARSSHQTHRVYGKDMKVRIHADESYNPEHMDKEGRVHLRKGDLLEAQPANDDNGRVRIHHFAHPGSGRKGHLGSFHVKQSTWNAIKQHTKEESTPGAATDGE